MGAKRKRPEKTGDADDISLEPEEEGMRAANPEQKIAKLKEELAQCKKERQEYLDGWQRLKADVVNARKEETERAQRQSAQARIAIISDLLAVLDSFDMARTGAAWEALDANWRSGMEQVASQFEQVLEQYGATRFGTAGEAFDPSLHEAVGEEPVSNKADDSTITAVVRSGWKRADGRVIRPAQVTVGKYAEK